MSIETRLTRLEETADVVDPGPITIVVHRADMAALRGQPGWRRPSARSTPHRRRTEVKVSFDHRLSRLEARVDVTPSSPTHAEMMAAQQRVSEAVRAKLAAYIAGEPWTRGPDLARDRETIRHYC